MMMVMMMVDEDEDDEQSLWMFDGFRYKRSE